LYENEIYAINEKQRICHIDLRDLKITMKRKIRELSNPEEVISSHIQQVTLGTFAIGSVIKESSEEAIFKCYLHLIHGDILDPNEDLQIKKFEMPLLGTFDSKKLITFRTIFVEER